MTETAFVAAFALGLAGAGHCLGMCGGIAAALSLGGSAGPVTILGYHTGRILSYTILGALIGGLAGVLDMAGWLISLRYLSGILLVAMGLYIADWWRGMSLLERAGARLWQPVQKMTRGWLPIRHPHQALLLGLCWGLMPCGLIYSSLAWAGTAADPLRSGLLMLCFGLGTLPTMLATSLGAERAQAALRRRGLKVIIAVFLIGAGCWTLYQVASHGAHHHSGHPQAEQGQHHH